MARDWDALIETGTVEVNGQSLTFLKRGVGRIAEEGASNPVLLDAIEALADAQKANAGKKVSTTDVAKQALAKLAGSKQTTEGKMVRQVVQAAPSFIINIIVADTVLEDREEEEAGYRRWLNSLGPTQLFDVLSGWMQVNLPEFHEPFVKGATKALTLLDQGWAGLTAKLASDASPARPAKR